MLIVVVFTVVNCGIYGMALLIMCVANVAMVPNSMLI